MSLESPITAAYHWVFLTLTVVSFVFGMVTAALGIAFAFSHPEQAVASIGIQAVAALGFFFSRWCQNTYAPLLREVTQTQRENILFQDKRVLDDPEILRTIVEYLVRSHPGLKDREATVDPDRLKEIIKEY